MKHTQGEWVPDVHHYPKEPKEIYIGIKVKSSTGLYQRIFDTILPETDSEYLNEVQEIKANVKLACAAPDLLEALIEMIRAADLPEGNKRLEQARNAINKATQ